MLHTFTLHTHIHVYHMYFTVWKRPLFSTAAFGKCLDFINSTLVVVTNSGNTHFNRCRWLFLATYMRGFQWNSITNLLIVCERKNIPQQKSSTLLLYRIVLHCPPDSSIVYKQIHFNISLLNMVSSALAINKVCTIVDWFVNWYRK